MQTKICSKCGENKLLSAFYKQKKCLDGVRPECKVCQNVYGSAKQKETNTINPNRRYNVVLKNKYGINFEVYKLMLEDQGNACAVCRVTSPSGQKRYFSVDHCHETGRIRGLLCQRCNTGLGIFSDKIELFEKAISYLRGDL